MKANSAANPAVIAYLAQIGRRGGSSKSKRKGRASRRNAVLANAARAAQFKAKQLQPENKGVDT